MPNDDDSYEIELKIERKRKEINKLLKVMEKATDGPVFATPWIWYMIRIVKVLKIMNGVE